MSKQYPGGIITKTPVTPGGPYANNSAPGVWTLEQQAYWQKLGQWPTQGNYNPNAFIENLFSTYLTTGAGATINVVNGIDLSTYGGLVWQKGRNGSATAHTLFDTVRGINNGLFTNSTSAQSSSSNWFTAFNSNGFSFGTGNNLASSGQTGVNWTFREQAKFFDIVTYTGNGSNRDIAHNLGSAPGFMIIKSTTLSDDWYVFHQSLGAGGGLTLNTANAYGSAGNLWDSTYPSSTFFRLGTNTGVNANGQQYIAYLFASNAGGFGVSGLDNVITCGSLVSGTVQDINLGYEPQWIVYKNADSSGGWGIFDTMRGMPTSGEDAYVLANTTAAETTASSQPSPLATGFRWNYTGNSGNTFIYIAIRRGPMKAPTLGTSVFAQQSVSESTSGSFTNTMTSNFPVDVGLEKFRTGTSFWPMPARLMGTYLYPNSTLAQNTTGTSYQTIWASNTQLTMDAPVGTTGTTIMYAFRRAPSFMDVVCYTGTGTSTTTQVSHNLTVIPELIILKERNGATNWKVMCALNGSSSPNLRYGMELNTTITGYLDTAGAYQTYTTSTYFNPWLVGAGVPSTNTSGQTYVAYLFATCAGVSKVGSYTGTGALQTINCGFAAGARFVLIKRTDDVGDWYVYDSARGITSGNDPYLFMNSTAAEVTGTNYVDTDTTGFQVTAAAPAGLNASGGTYIFLAIA